MKWMGRAAAAKLKTAEKAEMLARWKATIGKPPRFATSRELVAMALAWHLQQRKYGGLKPLVQRKLEALARAYRRGKLPAAPLQACSFRPGTTLVKFWRGRRYTVVAVPYGFRYRGKIYYSLSPIAREITGTRCNGPAFFGLRKRKEPAGSGYQLRVRQRFAAVRPPPIVHQETTRASERQAIDERELADSLERVLAPSRRQLETRERFDPVGALLTGLIFDNAGRRMSPIRADQGARRHRYYASQSYGEGARSLLRVSAPELEKLVANQTLEALKGDVRTRTYVMKLAGYGEITRRQFLRVMIKRVEVAPSLIRLHLDGATCRLFAQSGPIVITNVPPPVPIAVEIPLNIQHLPTDGLQPEVDPHPALIKAVVRSYIWRTELMNGTIETVGRLVKKVRFRRDYVLRILRLGFLAPEIIEAILNGKLPLALNLQPLNHPIPLDWAEQREFFGLSAHHSSSDSSNTAAAKIIPFRPTNSPKLL